MWDEWRTTSGLSISYVYRIANYQWISSKYDLHTPDAKTNQQVTTERHDRVVSNPAAYCHDIGVYL
jgi:hypothetical protein